MAAEIGAEPANSAPVGQRPRIRGTSCLEWAQCHHWAVHNNSWIP
jgi:hypothetical protein